MFKLVFELHGPQPTTGMRERIGEKSQIMIDGLDPAVLTRDRLAGAKRFMEQGEGADLDEIAALDRDEARISETLDAIVDIVKRDIRKRLQEWAKKREIVGA